MQATNIKYYHNLPFEDYLQLPGLSFSKIKNFDNPEIIPTQKMQFGTRVDAYIFTPSSYDGQQYDLVKPVVSELQKFFGTSLLYAEPQLSFTCILEHEDMYIEFKGRPDLKVHDLIIDLKVSALNPLQAIEFFRYDWQLSGYGAGCKAKRSMVISINPKTKKVSCIPIDFKYDWWHYQIKRFGNPIKKYV